MMKRIVSITLVVLMIAAMFVGCGSSSPEGLYKIKTVNGKSMMDSLKEEAGDEMTEEQIKALLSFLGIDNIEEAITFELKADGTLSVKMMGEESTGTWKVEGDKITMTIDGDSVTGTYASGKITVKMDDQEMVLAK